MTNYQPSADTTAAQPTNQSNALSVPITGRRQDRLVPPLRAVFDRLRNQDDTVSQPHQYGYGLIEMQCTRVFRQVTDDGRLHVIDLIQGDIIDGVNSYLITADGRIGRVFPSAYTATGPGGDAGVPGNIDEVGTNNPRGTVLSGRFSGTGRFGEDPNNGSQIRLYDGTQNAADADLVAQTALEDTFIGRGLSYIWGRFTFREGEFSGDPDPITVYARSRKIVDPRDASSSTVFADLAQSFSVNAYCILFDYLTRPESLGGLGVDLDLLDLPSFQAGATLNETVVTTIAFSKRAILTTRTNQDLGVAPINTNHLLEFNEAVTPFEFGDVVRLNPDAGQELPSGLSSGVDYHVVPIRPIVGLFQVTAIALASSFENALAGITIPQGTRSTDINVTKVGEIRYHTGIVYRGGDNIIEQLLNSCGARFFLKDGKIAVTRQVYPEAGDIEAVGLDELIGRIALSTSIEPDDRATSLVGSFTGLSNLFIPRDYPEVSGGGTFVEADGEDLLRPFNLQAVGKNTVAQRLARVELLRRRQELSVSFAGDLALFRLRPGTVCTLDFPRYGLDANTPFEVRNQVIFLRVSGDQPSLNIDIQGRQLESTTFDLNVDEETFLAEASIPGINSPFEVAGPSNVTVNEELFQTRLGAGVRARVILTWDQSESLFVTRYEIFLRRTGTETFFPQGEVPATDLNFEINDLEPAAYDFLVVSVNSVGRRSGTGEGRADDVTIQGLSAPPSAPTTFRGQVIGAATVLLRWDRTTDLDVREGGFVEIRHSPLITGAEAQDSTFLDTDVGGQTSITVPFKQGTYFLRFEDSTGQFSEPAEWSTQDRRPVGIAFLPAGLGLPLDETNTDPDAFSIQEDNTFPGTFDATTPLVLVSGALELPLSNTFDDVVDVDAETDFDVIGGGTVEPLGIYNFSTSIQLDTRTLLLVESVLAAEVFDLSTSIDGVPNMDLVASIDQVGAVLLIPGLATAEIQVRFSDDPIASDNFGPWETIDTQFIEALSWQFRLVQTSTQPTVNIRTTQARIRLRTASFT